MSKKPLIQNVYNPLLGNGIDVAHPTELAEISRRQLLQTGVSLTAWASAGQLIGAGSVAAQSTSYAPQRNLIWINMNGGWDILEVTDPKPQSTSGIDMSYSWGGPRYRIVVGRIKDRPMAAEYSCAGTGFAGAPRSGHGDDLPHGRQCLYGYRHFE